MSDDAIDKAILSVLSAYNGRWKKVAMVIGRVAYAMGKDMQEENDSYHQLIAQRIAILVSKGRLVAQGNIKNWRFSEIRVPD